MGLIKGLPKVDPIDRLVKDISSALECLEVQCPPDRDAEVDIPFGVIRKINVILPEYDFIKDQILKRNVCYAVQALDLQRWLLIRFRLYGPIKSYVVKNAIILCNMIVEALTVNYLKVKGIQKNEKHSKNIKKLRQAGAGGSLCDSMDSLRTRRENIHLHLVHQLETNSYTMKDWDLSIKCLGNVRAALKV